MPREDPSQLEIQRKKKSRSDIVVVVVERMSGGQMFMRRGTWLGKYWRLSIH